jgi:hypothetical protein
MNRKLKLSKNDQICDRQRAVREGHLAGQPPADGGGRVGGDGGECVRHGLAGRAAR